MSRKSIILLLKIALAAGLFVGLGTAIGWGDLARALGAADPELIALALAVGMASRWVEAVQMGVILRRAGLEVPTWNVLLANATSTLYGLVLPGDVVASAVKWADLARSTGDGPSVLSAIAYNRLFLLLPWSFLSVVVLGFWNPWSEPALAAATGAVAFLLTLLFFAARWSGAARLLRPLSRLVGHRAGRTRRTIAFASGSLVTLRRLGVSPWPFHGTVFAVSLGNVFLQLLSFQLMAVAVGVRVPPAAMAVVRSVTVALRQIPISFNGIGLNEVTLVGLLHPLGARREDAFSLGVILLANVITFAVIGALRQAGILRPYAIARREAEDDRTEGSRGQEEIPEHGLSTQLPAKTVVRG